MNRPASWPGQPHASSKRKPSWADAPTGPVLGVGNVMVERTSSWLKSKVRDWAAEVVTMQREKKKQKKWHGRAEREDAFFGIMWDHIVCLKTQPRAMKASSNAAVRRGGIFNAFVLVGAKPFGLQLAKGWETVQFGLLSGKKRDLSSFEAENGLTCGTRTCLMLAPRCAEVCFSFGLCLRHT